MKIKLISDTHFEFYEDLELYKNPGNADVLVIAGDLNVGHLRCWSSLKRFADAYKDVIYTSGNHEYYGGNISEFDDYIQRFSRNSNIHYLNPGTVKLGDVTFIGANLWSNFNNNQFSKMYCGQSINDFRRINGFATGECAALNTRHTKFFKDAYAAVEGKKVFVSHFLPDRLCIDEQYKGETALNDYFANNLGDWIQDLDNSTWFHGHTHSIVRQEIGTTKIYANPYGYNKNDSYQELFIEL
jgi:predicted phosphodiesterase